MEQQTIIYLNNCRGREHERIYGKGAFYDLSFDGRQASQATNLDVGQPCVVASYEEDGNIRFDWWIFEKEIPLQDDEDVRWRVMFGTQVFDETLSKAKAAESSRYSSLFNVVGHFKRPSVVVGIIDADRLPVEVLRTRSNTLRQNDRTDDLLDKALAEIRTQGRDQCSFDDVIAVASQLAGSAWTEKMAETCLAILRERGRKKT